MLQDDGIRELLEDLEVDDLGSEDGLELPDWEFEEAEEYGMEVQEEVTYINGLEVVRYVRPPPPSPPNRHVTCISRL